MSTNIELVQNWIIGGLGAFVVLSAIVRIIEACDAQSQKRIITAVAFGNGFALEIGLSPIGTFATELVPLSPLLTANFSSLIRALLAVGTVIEILYGLSKTKEGSGWIGVTAFFLAFCAGILIPYQDTALFGVFLLLAAGTFMEFAPTRHWWSGR